MMFVQATTGGGGWPMSVWLTPDLEPIVGGTYFPPEDAHGRTGFLPVLQRISDAWQKDEKEMRAQAGQVTDQMRQFSAPTSAGASAAADTARDILEYVARDLTSSAGGFHSAEDADSLAEGADHKTEGAFYIWKQEEIDRIPWAVDLQKKQDALFWDKQNGGYFSSTGEDPSLQEMLRTIRARFLPGAVTVLIDDPASRTFFGEHAEFYGSVTEIDGKPTAYVCENFVCQLPTTDPKTLAKQLTE